MEKTQCLRQIPKEVKPHWLVQGDIKTTIEKSFLITKFFIFLQKVLLIIVVLQKLRKQSKQAMIPLRGMAGIWF